MFDLAEYDRMVEVLRDFDRRRAKAQEAGDQEALTALEAEADQLRERAQQFVGSLEVTEFTSSGRHLREK